MHLVVDKWILTTVRRGELLNDSENERLAQSDALVDTTDTTTATAATILQGESQTQSQQQHHQHQSVLIDEHIEQEQQLYQPIDEITSSSPSSCTINHHLQQHQHQHYRICSATNNTTSQTITESVRFESMPVSAHIKNANSICCNSICLSRLAFFVVAIVAHKCWKSNRTEYWKKSKAIYTCIYKLLCCFSHLSFLLLLLLLLEKFTTGASCLAFYYYTTKQSQAAVYRICVHFLFLTTIHIYIHVLSAFALVCSSL